MKINVAKSFLPPFEEFTKILAGVWDRNQLTNQGPLLTELEVKLREFLRVKHLQICSNGTIALQLALRLCDIEEAEVITTPFSYVATASSILWEKNKPVFVDIEPDNFNIDSAKIEAKITERTKAIMAVHVFGYPCAVRKIEAIAKKHNLKVIYDGAHAFGSTLDGVSLLSFGDISTCSFHATKLFHMGEGGAVIINSADDPEKLWLLKSFGHRGDEHFTLGINGKNSELHAALGLANFPYVAEIIKNRKIVSEGYDSQLGAIVGRPKIQKGLNYNYAYYPVLLKSEAQLLDVKAALEKIDVIPRRYFYPSLNTLPYLGDQRCPISEDIALRVLCLPLYPDLAQEDRLRICGAIKNVCGEVQ